MSYHLPHTQQWSEHERRGLDMIGHHDRPEQHGRSWGEEMTHSQEPWVTDTMYKANITDADDRTFSVGNSFIPENIANARRIVACVNALAGIEAEAIEAGAVGKLVEAARAIVSAIEGHIMSAQSHYEPCPDMPCTKEIEAALKPFPAASA